MVTKGNKYEATVAEKKLLEVLLDPENRLLNVTELCNLAGISRKTYYEAFKNPNFVELVRVSSIDLIKKSMVELIKIGLEYARKGSAQHWKVLLEMAEIYKQKVEEDTNRIITFRFADPSSDEE